MKSDKVQSLFLHQWCQVWLACRPVGLQSKCLLRRLETVLECIVVRFKRKITWVFVQEFFGESLLSVSLSGRSFLGVVLCGRPERVISIEFDESILHRCLGATQCGANVHFCISVSM